MWLVLKGIYLLAGAGITGWLLVVVSRSKRRLDARVEQFKAEQEENQGPPPNPYQALAELYAEDERRNQEARKKRKR